MGLGMRCLVMNGGVEHDSKKIIREWTKLNRKKENRNKPIITVKAVVPTGKNIKIANSIITAFPDPVSSSIPSSRKSEMWMVISQVVCIFFL